MLLVTVRHITMSLERLDDRVDLEDLAKIAAVWLKTYDLNDLSVIAENWLVY